MAGGNRESFAPRPGDVGPARSRSRRRIRQPLLKLTLADLVEAVGAFTVDSGEQALVVDHILRTRSRRDPRRIRDA